MITWEAPSALWLSLAVPAIVLLWFLRPRRPRQRIPSLFLWPGAPAERQAARPWQRLRARPLFWLQVLAAMLLALAAARPFWPATAAGQNVVVFLDATGSMRALDGGTDRFAAARATVLSLARSLGPGQEMTVIRLDSEPRVLVANARTATQIETALIDESPSFGASTERAPAEWVLVSDGGLGIPDDVVRPTGTSFRHLIVGQNAANVAITGLISRRGPDGLTLQAGVRNLGQTPVSGRLQLLAETQLVSAQDWTLDAGGETRLTWSHLADQSRWYHVRLSGVPESANALLHDDQAWVGVGGAPEPSVLLVTAGNTFLERALSSHGGVRPFRTTPADWPRLASRGTTYPLTVLDRLWPPDLPPGSSLVVGPPDGATFRPGSPRPRSDHPLIRHVDWSDVQVLSARAVSLDATWETIVDSDGGPLLAVRETGGRRQAVLTFDLSQSDLPLRPAFPVLMANLLDWLLPRPGEAPRAVAPGVAITIDASPLARDIWVEDAEGRREQVAPPWPPAPFRPGVPGLYRVVQEGDGARTEFVLVADGYHSQEADLTPRSIEIPLASGEVPPVAQGVLSFWPSLAALILLLSMAEWWIDARGR